MLVCFMCFAIFPFQPMPRLIVHLLQISCHVFFLGFKITLGPACVMLFPFPLFSKRKIKHFLCILDRKQCYWLYAKKKLMRFKLFSLIFLFWIFLLSPFFLGYDSCSTWWPLVACSGKHERQSFWCVKLHQINWWDERSY